MPKIPSTQQYLNLHDLFATRRQTFINVAARIIGCRNHAEDVVQDAYIKLFSAKMLPSIQSQSGYLLRVVRNLAIDLYRRQSLEKRHIRTEEEKLLIAEPCTSLETDYQHRQTLDILSSALTRMPERTRYAFEMCRLYGYKQKDVAKQLGVSATQVNYMVRDALLHCRQALERTENRAP